MDVALGVKILLNTVTRGRFLILEKKEKYDKHS